MGFLGLIPASKLAAGYNPLTQTLTLYAQGEVQDYTAGIEFDREPLLGGLKFRLQGWTGPLGKGTSPYSHQQRFQIHLPSPVTPSGNVIIVTQNHPNGVVVPIRWVGLGAENDQPATQPTTELASAEAETSEAAAPAATAPQTLTPNQEQLNVLFKMPFQIKEASQVPTGGSVTLKYDPRMLQIQEAGIQGGNIVWTMNSLQTGNTQVIVTISGGIAQYVIQKVYDVRVFVLDQMQAAPANPQAILSFLGRVNIAVRLVQDQYPDAQLYEVEALPPVPEKVSNPNALSKLKVVFRAGNGTAVIKSTGWGTFGPVQYVDQPWLEDVVIPWPIRMEATEADALLKKAGYTGTYGAMTLRHPLYPGIEQPYYIFSMNSGQYVFVGVNDGKVTTNPVDSATVAKNSTAEVADKA